MSNTIDTSANDKKRRLKLQDSPTGKTNLISTGYVQGKSYTDKAYLLLTTVVNFVKLKNIKPVNVSNALEVHKRDVESQGDNPSNGGNDASEGTSGQVEEVGDTTKLRGKLINEIDLLLPLSANNFSTPYKSSPSVSNGELPFYVTQAILPKSKTTIDINLLNNFEELTASEGEKEVEVQSEEEVEEKVEEEQKEPESDAMVEDKEEVVEEPANSSPVAESEMSTESESITSISSPLLISEDEEELDSEPEPEPESEDSEIESEAAEENPEPGTFIAIDEEDEEQGQAVPAARVASSLSGTRQNVVTQEPGVVVESANNSGDAEEYFESEPTGQAPLPIKILTVEEMVGSKALLFGDDSISSSILQTQTVKSGLATFESKPLRQREPSDANSNASVDEAEESPVIPPVTSPVKGVLEASGTLTEVEEELILLAGGVVTVEETESVMTQEPEKFVVVDEEDEEATTMPAARVASSLSGTRQNVVTQEPGVVESANNSGNAEEYFESEPPAAVGTFSHAPEQIVAEEKVVYAFDEQIIKTQEDAITDPVVHNEGAEVGPVIAGTMPTKLKIMITDDPLVLKPEDQGMSGANVDRIEYNPLDGKVSKGPKQQKSISLEEDLGEQEEDEANNNGGSKHISINNVSYLILPDVVQHGSAEETFEEFDNDDDLGKDLQELEARLTKSPWTPIETDGGKGDGEVVVYDDDSDFSLPPTHISHYSASSESFDSTNGINDNFNLDAIPDGAELPSLIPQQLSVNPVLMKSLQELEQEALENTLDIAAKKLEIDELDLSLNDIKDQKDKLTNQRNILQQELERIANNAANIEVRIEKTQRNINDDEENLEVLQQALKHISEKTANIETQIEGTQRNINDDEENLEVLQQALKHISEKTANIETQIEGTQRNINDDEENLEVLQQALKRIAEKTTDLSTITQSEPQVHLLLDPHIPEELYKTISELSDVECIKKSIKALEQRIIDTQEALTTKKGGLDTLNEELESSKAGIKALEQRIIDTQEALTTKKGGLDTLNEELELLAEAEDEIQYEIQNVDDQLSDTENNCTKTTFVMHRKQYSIFNLLDEANEIRQEQFETRDKIQKAEDQIKIYEVEDRINAEQGILSTSEQAYKLLLDKSEKGLVNSMLYLLEEYLTTDDAHRTEVSEKLKSYSTLLQSKEYLDQVDRELDVLKEKIDVQSELVQRLNAKLLLEINVNITSGTNSNPHISNINTSIDSPFTGYVDVNIDGDVDSTDQLAEEA